MKLKIKRLVNLVFAIGVVFICQACGPTSPTSSEPVKSGLDISIRGSNSKSAATHDYAQFVVAVKNNGPSPVVLTYVKKVVSLPNTDWLVSFCVGSNCYSPKVDSVDSALPIPVGCTDTCSLDISTGAAGGTATVVFKIYDKADPAQKLEQTFSCTVVSN